MYRLTSGVSNQRTSVVRAENTTSTTSSAPARTLKRRAATERTHTIASSASSGTPNVRLVPTGSITVAPDRPTRLARPPANVFTTLLGTRVIADQVMPAVW